jgi:hypothetical protein
VDLGLSHNGKAGAWTWSAGLNFTYARNRVDYLDEVTGLPAYQRQEGRPMGVGLYYRAAGIFQDQAEADAYPRVLGAGPGDLRFEDVDGDGAITETDRVRARYSNTPEITYGIPLSLGWRGLDFNVLLQGQANASQYILLESGSTGNFFAEDAQNRWRPGQPSNAFPRVADKMYDGVNGAYPNTFWLQNMNFLRLKNLELGYTLPDGLLEHFKIKGLRVYLSGFNLLTFDRLGAVDPEGNSEAGVFHPQQRIYNAGLNVSF